MIRVLLRQRIDDKAFRERRRISMGEVCKVTGIPRATLTRIANIPGYPINMAALDALCTYFECQPGDLLVWVRDDDEPADQ